MPPASLLCGSRLSAGACARAHLPCTSSASLACDVLTDENESTATKKVLLAMAMVAGGPGRRGRWPRRLGRRRDYQGERETDEVQGSPRGSGASAGRQERPWRL